MGLVAPVSVYCDRVRLQVWSATSVSVWQHIQLSRQIKSFESVRWDACVHRLNLGIYGGVIAVEIFWMYFVNRSSSNVSISLIVYREAIALSPASATPSYLLSAFVKMSACCLK